MSTPTTGDHEPHLHGRELDRIISLQEACRVSSLSVDGWKRHHAGKLVRLSPRRLTPRHSYVRGPQRSASVIGTSKPLPAQPLRRTNR